MVSKVFLKTLCILSYCLSLCNYKSFHAGRELQNLPGHHESTKAHEKFPSRHLRAQS